MAEPNSKVPDSTDQPLGNSFPKAVRLRKSGEFEAVYGLRQSAGDNLLVVHGKYNGLATARLGLTVSRRVGNAVVRNRWKRSLREAFRQVRHRLPALDLVVAPRPGIQPVVAELMVSLSSLVGRVEKRLRTGAAPYPPRAKQKQSKKKPERPQKPAPDSPT
jgi:ribonuclease P protein component